MLSSNRLNLQQAKTSNQASDQLKTSNPQPKPTKQVPTPKQIVEFASEKRSLHFNIDPESGILIIQVFDGSGNLIRQIPHEEIISQSQRLDKVRGMLFDDTI